MGGACNYFMHGRSYMFVDSRILTMRGRSMSGFTGQAGIACVHQAAGGRGHHCHRTGWMDGCWHRRLRDRRRGGEGGGRQDDGCCLITRFGFNFLSDGSIFVFVNGRKAVSMLAGGGSRLWVVVVVVDKRRGGGGGGTFQAG